jgi:hypothetical protein
LVTDEVADWVIQVKASTTVLGSSPAAREAICWASPVSAASIPRVS